MNAVVKRPASGSPGTAPGDTPLKKARKKATATATATAAATAAGAAGSVATLLAIRLNEHIVDTFAALLRDAKALQKALRSQV